MRDRIQRRHRLERILLQMFGRPSGWMGRLGGHIMARTNAGFASAAIRSLDIQATDQILEVGFGPGVAIGLLAEKAIKGKVAGVDASPEMVSQAGKRNTAAIRSGQVELFLGVAEDLPFETGRFDKALAINSMQIWADIPAGLGEVHRVLSPGGKAVFGFTRHSGRSKGGVLDLLAEAGFLHGRLVDLEHGFLATASRPRLPS